MTHLGLGRRTRCRLSPGVEHADPAFRRRVEPGASRHNHGRAQRMFAPFST
jgi:hypothetical protein